MNILSIGGSDPSSGAGIQSDIKAASVLGVNCFSVITAITSQNSVKFHNVETVSTNAIEQQIDSILSDFDIDVINIGMVYDSEIIKKIHSKLKNLKIPIVLDPVIKSTTGGVLLRESALSTFKRLLIPLAYAITPNVREAEVLSGVKIRNSDDLLKAARRIHAKNVIITGHHFIKNKISDFIFENGNKRSISGKKVSGQTHGSGCNFAIAMAYSIAKKKSILESVKFAKEFSYEAIKSSQKIGSGVKITSPKKDQIKTELDSAIKEFQGMNNVHLLIPECQTNFVFARQNSKSTSDVIGIAGRIVKTGKSLVVAGELEYGGSRHVASAVLSMQKKFPQIRSALNIRFDERLLKKFQKAKSRISNYDRVREPLKIKLKENSSISWGVQSAIKNSNLPPDIIYHKGDFGKEAMIIIFGKNPKDVVAKISKIL